MRPATRASRGSAYPFRGRRDGGDAPREPAPRQPTARGAAWPRGSSGRAATPAGRPSQQRAAPRPRPAAASPDLAPLVYETQRRVDALRDTLDGLTGASDRLREVAQVVVEDHGRALVRLERATPAQRARAQPGRRAAEAAIAEPRARRGAGAAVAVAEPRTSSPPEPRADVAAGRPSRRRAGATEAGRAGARRPTGASLWWIARRRCSWLAGSREPRCCSSAATTRRRDAPSSVPGSDARGSRSTSTSGRDARRVRVGARYAAGVRHRPRGRPLRRRRRRRGRAADRRRRAAAALRRARDDRRRDGLGARARRARRQRQAAAA